MIRSSQSNTLRTGIPNILRFDNLLIKTIKIETIYISYPKGDLMPLYRYLCNDCKLEFEEIKKYEDRDTKLECPGCTCSDTSRVLAVSFGIGTTLDPKRDTIYSPKEIDKVVGTESDKKWEGYDQRWKKRYEETRKKRWEKSGATPVDLNIPKDKDGKYSPIMHLGDKNEREFRKDYSDSLKEHRVEREKKGLGQFDGMGDRDSVVKLVSKKDTSV
jgi:putative FmdB family regulatory protein